MNKVSNGVYILMLSFVAIILGVVVGQSVTGEILIILTGIQDKVMKFN